MDATRPDPCRNARRDGREFSKLRCGICGRSVRGNGSRSNGCSRWRSARCRNSSSSSSSSSGSGRGGSGEGQEVPTLTSLTLI